MRFLSSRAVLLLLLVRRMFVRPAVASCSVAVARSLDFSVTLALRACGDRTVLNAVTIYKGKKVL